MRRVVSTMRKEESIMRKVIMRRESTTRRDIMRKESTMRRDIMRKVSFFFLFSILHYHYLLSFFSLASFSFPFQIVFF